MIELIPYIDRIKSLCLDTNVEELYLFGSALTDKFSSSSDIDLLVDFKTKTPLEYSNKYFKLKFEMEDLLGRPIDLLEKRSLRNPHLIASIERHKTLIYAA
jgi:predicted nucleotidyltransferase